MKKAVFILLLLLGAPARAAEPWQAWVSETEFRALCEAASRNVIFFNDVWEKYPNAVFYGGTSRDLAWHVRGRLAAATTAAQAEAIKHELRTRPIDIRDFVVGQSDVDVITDRPITGIAFDPAFLTRVEMVSPEWFSSTHPRFAQEQMQGYVPVEKIRLGKNGFGEAEGLTQGDGLREIYTARPTFHYDERIKQTEFFDAHENHPILLALRYLRQVAIAYYRVHGTGYPSAAALNAIIDDRSRAGLDKVLGELKNHPDSLTPFLANDKFLTRLNRALGKAFRSYTNPTATSVLFQTLGLDALLAHYGDKIEPYHTLMYQKHRNQGDLAFHRAQLPFDPKTYLETFSSYYRRNGISLEKDAAGDYAPVFHGARSMENYRNIVFQGNIASKKGSAGDGTYVTDPRSADYSRRWGSQEGYLVKLKVRPDATFVDITHGPGKEAWDPLESTCRHASLSIL